MTSRRIHELDLATAPAPEVTPLTSVPRPLTHESLLEAIYDDPEDDERRRA